MVYAWAFLTTFTILAYAVHKLNPAWLEPSIVEFSSFHLKNHCYWVFFTATFIHAGASHVINNMIMLAVYAPYLETEIGSWAFFLLYLLTGVVGWTFTLISNARTFGESADMVWSCGSSPSMYGMAFFYAFISPTTLIGGTYIPDWLWLVLVVLVPKCFSKKYYKKLKRLGLIKYAIISCILDYFFLRPLIRVCFGGLTPVAWIVLYLTNICTFRAYSLWKKEGTLAYPGSDNTTHFGGAVAGAVLGLSYNQNSWQTMDRTARVWIILCYLLLITRQCTNF